MSARRKAEPVLPGAPLANAPLADTPLPGTLMPRDQQTRMVPAGVGQTEAGGRMPGRASGRAHYSDEGDKDQTVPI